MNISHNEKEEEEQQQEKEYLPPGWEEPREVSAHVSEFKWVFFVYDVMRAQRGEEPGRGRRDGSTTRRRP